MPPRLKLSRKQLIKLGVAISAVMLLLSGGLVFVMYNFVQPPPRAPLASIDLESGKPFELEFASDGQPARVFLDLDCESCSFPITGALRLSSGGMTIYQNEISAGDGRDRAWGGTDRKLEQHLLFDPPAAPAGRLKLSGTLIVGPARGNLSTAPVKGAPPPRVKRMHLTIAL